MYLSLKIQGWVIFEVLCSSLVSFRGFSCKFQTPKFEVKVWSQWFMVEVCTATTSITLKWAICVTAFGQSAQLWLKYILTVRIYYLVAVRILYLKILIFLWHHKITYLSKEVIYCWVWHQKCSLRVILGNSHSQIQELMFYCTLGLQIVLPYCIINGIFFKW